MRWAVLPTALFAALATPALATLGPFIFVDTKSDVMFGADGAIHELHETWLFDPMYSDKVLTGAPKSDRPAISELLARLAETQIKFIAEHGYYIAATAAGTRVGFAKPLNYAIEERADKRLTLRFDLPMARPVLPGKAFAFQINDPAFFVGFDYQATSQPAALVNAPAGCGIRAIPGSETEAEADTTNLQIDRYRAYNVVSCPSRGDEKDR